MKNHDLDAPVSLLRRRLLLGAPAGLLLDGPLALLGCGGNSDGAPAASEGSLHDSGRAFVGSTSFSDVAVSVDVPAGVVVPAGGLAAHTMIGGFGTVSGGVATLRLLFDAPQLATLYTADALPLLFGFVGAGLPPISARSTATVLIAFAIGTEWAEDSANRSWIAQIQASDAAAVLADVIASALVADVYALAGGSAAIDQGIAAAVKKLLPAGLALGLGARARPLGISIDPPNASSGVQPIIAEALNTSYVQNEKLRRAWYVIRREGYVGADGTAVTDPARPSIVEGDIPMLPGFDSASAIITAVTDAYYSGDDSSLAFSKTAETALTLVPADARNTTYSVTVLMAGNPAAGYDQAAFDKLSATEKLKIDISSFSPQHLGLQTLVMDLLVPMFLSWLGGKVSDQGTGLGAREHKQKIEIALLGQLLGVLTSTIPGVVAKLQDPKNNPNYGIGGALVEIATKHLVDTVEVPVPGRAQPVVLPVLSKFSITMITLLLKYIAYEKMNVANGEALLNFLESKFVNGDENKDGQRLYSWNVGKDKDGKDKFVHFDKDNLAFAGVGVAMKALATVDTILGHLGKIRALADISTSKLLETWQVKTTKPKLRLNPNPFEVDPIGGTFPLHLDIVDNDNDIYGIEKGSFSYDWVCVARFGDLFKRNFTPDAAQEKNVFTTSNANATADFVPNGMTPDGGAPDTVKVTVYFEPIGAKKPRELIGTVSTTIKYKKPFSLRISPPGPIDVPTDSSMGVSAFFKETLPAGATVAWEWSHAGVGSLAAVAPDANPSDSTVNLLTDASEGSATVTVQATVDVPASGTTPSHFVITDPVSAILTVKKGVKTLTFEASAGNFACTDPKVCGVDAYSAFIVPVVQNAQYYTAVLSGFGYPACNRSVTWSAPVGDGGDCNFPVSYHPHTSAGKTNLWAVWIGFGFGAAPSGGEKCVVTITLNP